MSSTLLRQLFCILFYCLLPVHTRSGQVERAVEETAWTRHTWGEFKLQLPVSSKQPSDDKLLSSIRAQIQGCHYASIDGPQERSLLPPHQRVPLIPVPQPGEGSAASVEVISKDSNVYLAAKAIRCPVCYGLVEDVFQTVQLVAGFENIITEDGLAALLHKSCEEKILHTILGDRAVTVAAPPGEPEADGGSGGGEQKEQKEPARRRPAEGPRPKDRSQAAYSLQPRPAALPVNEKEIAAVKTACKSVVTDLDAHIAEKMYVVLRELKRAERVLVEPRGNGECNDVHSNCPLWALRGECSKNPKYMLSHCKSSCGACSAAEGGREPPHKRLQAAALQRILDETCKEFSPCRPRGQSSDRAPAKQAPSFHERVLRHELSRPDPPMPPLAEEVPGGGAEEDPALLLEELIAQDIGDLANKCIYLNQGWWTYQLCYKRSIRQIHIEDREVKVQHELGTFHTAFTLEANQRGPEILDAEDLMPEMSLPLPFVKHIFTDGSQCEGTELRREAELRIACSLSEGIQMKVREPRKCAYVVVLYLPAVCQHPDLSPRGL